MMVDAKYRLRDVIDSIEYEELLKIRKDLDHGGFHLKQFVEAKIAQEEKKHLSYCSTCGSLIDTSKTNTFTLIFGPDDFRKKATFDGVDCLENFLNDIKKMKTPKKGIFNVVNNPDKGN